MRQIRFLILFLLLLFPLTIAPAAAENRVALVVGNANYRSIPSLTNPAADAMLMANTLKNLGFEIVGDEAQINLDKTALDRLVRKFGNQLQGADVGLFYYAGHGVQVRGANYLVPVNANPVREADVDFELEDLAMVLRQMDASGTRLNLVMLDACRNNPFGGRGLRAIDSGLAQMRAPQGTLISFATQPGNVAQDGSDGHSPYSKALAKATQRPGLGVFEVLNEVGLSVKKSTGGEQQPWLSSSPIEGNFYFSGPPKSDEAKPKADDEKKAASATPAAKEMNSEPAKPVASPPRPAEETKRTDVALAAPIQPAPIVSSEQEKKEDRGLNIYDGGWTSIVTGTCPHISRSHVVIRNGVISAEGASGRIRQNGQVSGSFGLLNGRFFGRMTSSTSGSGSYRDGIGCTGSWNLVR
jgi:uncharacterized caspase-like protein